MALRQTDKRGIRVGDVLAQRYVVLRVPADVTEAYVVYDTEALCRVHLRVCARTGELEVGEVIASPWGQRQTGGAREAAEREPPELHTAIPGTAPDEVAEALSRTPTVPDGVVAGGRGRGAA